MERSRQNLRRCANIMVSAIFLLAIFLPLADSVLHLDGLQLKEKRVLAKMPALPNDAETLREFPRQFEDFCNDNFGFRSRLISCLNLVRAKVFGISGAKNALIGEDDWLYFMPPRMVDYVRQVKPMSDRCLMQWKNVIEERYRWLDAHRIRFLFVVAPEKSAIYPEYLPECLQSVGRKNRQDQLFGYLAANSDAPFLDVRKKLLEAKNDGYVYLRTDTHWNPVGSYCVYAAIMEKLRKDDPSLSALSLDQFERREQWAPGGDLAGLMGVAPYFREASPVLTRKGGSLFKEQDYGIVTQHDFQSPLLLENPKGNGLTVVIIRDSYGNRIKPFIGETFTRTILLPAKKFDIQIILKEKPDIVIWETAERELAADYVVPNDFQVQHFAARIPPSAPRDANYEVVSSFDFAGDARRQEWKSLVQAQNDAQGLALKPDKEGPVLAYTGSIDAASAPAIRITLAGGGAPEFLRLYFARDKDVTEQNRNWPFAGARSVPFRRLNKNAPDAWTATPIENQEWSGAIRRCMISAGLPGTNSKVLVSKIELLK